MVTLIRRRVLRRLIWVCTVCLCPIKRALGLYGLIVIIEAIYSRWIYLTPCLTLGNFQHFFAVCYILFSKSLFSRISFFYTIRVSNSLDPAQTRHTDGSDLWCNSLQWLSADDTSRQMFKEKIVFGTIINSSWQDSSPLLICPSYIAIFQ